MLTQSEQTLTHSRPNTIDYDALSRMAYLGSYKRRLPISVARMMENAYDWEHLPCIHASTFASIDLIGSGQWGWRAKVGLSSAAGGGHQLLDLLVDMRKKYWATTIYDGVGTGLEIHTQATEVAEHEIDVDVRFYLPEAPESEAVSKTVLEYLTQQYKTLYDEDMGLMSGRQKALDDVITWRDSTDRPDLIKVGDVSDLKAADLHVVETPGGRFCVRRWNGAWLVHSAVCSHLLGPLDDSAVSGRGEIVCPWHGYRFDVETGENVDGKCGPLARAPELLQSDGSIFLRFDTD